MKSFLIVALLPYPSTTLTSHSLFRLFSSPSDTHARPSIACVRQKFASVSQSLARPLTLAYTLAGAIETEVRDGIAAAKSDFITAHTELKNEIQVRYMYSIPRCARMYLGMCMYTHTHMCVCVCVCVLCVACLCVYLCLQGIHLQHEAHP